MSRSKLNIIKIFSALIYVLCIFLITSEVCISGTPTGYAAIWRAADDNARKTMAVICFDAISALDVTIHNVTKHALKHIKAPSELPEATEEFPHGKLEKTLISWLSYEGWNDRIATLRQLIAGLYDIGNNITNIRRWVTGDTNITVELKNNFTRIWKYAYSLRDNIQAIAGPAGEVPQNRAVLHTYAIGLDPATDHYEVDMVEINQFIRFFPEEQEINRANVTAFITQGAVIPNNANDAARSTAEAQAARSRLKRLLHLQRNLFERMNLMTRKILQECFEPCVRAALRNAFHLQGVAQGTGAIGDLVAGGELADTISLSDYSETLAPPAIPILELADFGGNPPGTLPLIAIPVGNDLTSTVIKRTFATGATFTQFLRALVLATREGGPLEFEGLAEGVIRLDSVTQRADSVEVDPTTLSSAIKAARGEAAEGDIIDDTTTYTTSDGLYRRVIANPFIATIYAH